MTKLISLMLLAAFAGVAFAQAPYPNRPVRLVVPFPPGGGVDATARVLSQKLTEAWRQQVVVDNRTGAGTTIGTEIVARAAPDGYTLLLTNNALAISAGLYPKLRYETGKDFLPIMEVLRAPFVLVIPVASTAKTVRDLIALAKAKPGELTFGSGGNGSTAHLSGEMFKTMAGINIVHVPFKGSPAAVIGVISGQIAMAFPNLPPALPHVRSGKLKALAVTTAKRSAAVPELPTVAEAGLPGYEATAWFGVLAPAATPPQIIAKLNAAIVKSLRTREMQERLAAEGTEPVGNTPEQFAQIVRNDIAKWAKVVKSSGARPE